MYLFVLCVMSVHTVESLHDSDILLQALIF